jgi:phosphatidylinositol alpha-1,6-mannosyltransferase
MKTLLVSEVFPPRVGGSGRWLWEIYRRLPRESCVIVAGEALRQEEFDRTHDLRLVRMPLSFSTWGVASLSGLRQYGGTAWRLRRLVRAERVGTVHAGKCLPEGFLAWLLKRWRGLPYLCYVHGEELNVATTSRDLVWLTRRVLHGAAVVLANSHNTEGMLLRDWDVPAERIRVLHPGVDTGRFVPAPHDPESRAHLGWGDRPVVLTVSRLQKRKGHDTVIRALAEVRRTVPDVLYAIVGDGEERGPLERLTADLGLGAHVRFHGELSDAEMLDCYQQCDLFVLANRQVGQDIEGFGMVLLEAQACGKPVVAGASGGTAETMRVPDTGLVVPCDNPEPLAALLAELLPDRERLARMGDAGRQWAVEHFDWAALSRQALDLWPGWKQQSRCAARPSDCPTSQTTRQISAIDG